MELPLAQLVYSYGEDLLVALAVDHQLDLDVVIIGHLESPYLAHFPCPLEKMTAYSSKVVHLSSHTLAIIFPKIVHLIQSLVWVMDLLLDFHISEPDHTKSMSVDFAAIATIVVDPVNIEQATTLVDTHDL